MKRSHTLPKALPTVPTSSHPQPTPPSGEAAGLPGEGSLGGPGRARHGVQSWGVCRLHSPGGRGEAAERAWGPAPWLRALLPAYRGEAGAPELRLQSGLREGAGETLGRGLVRGPVSSSSSSFSVLVIVFLREPACKGPPLCPPASPGANQVPTLGGNRGCTRASVDGKDGSEERAGLSDDEGPGRRERSRGWTLRQTRVREGVRSPTPGGRSGRCPSARRQGQLREKELAGIQAGRPRPGQLSPVAGGAMAHSRDQSPASLPAPRATTGVPSPCL